MHAPAPPNVLRPPQEKKSDEAGAYSPGVKDIIGAAVEPALSMGTGVAGSAVGGIAGLGQMGNNALGIGTPQNPADVVQAVQGKMTYQPRTQGGKDALSAFQAPGELLHKGAEAISSPLGEAGYPGAAALEHTIVEGGPTILGLRGGAAAAELPGVMKPKPMAPTARLLADKGVTMTPGEALGGFAKAFEEKVSSFPVLGDIIKHARGKSVEQFSQVTVQDALSDIKVQLPKDYKGHQAIQFAKDQFDAAYNQLLPKLIGDLDNPPPTGSKLPVQAGAPVRGPVGSLRDELTNLKNLAQQGLPAEQAATVVRTIDQKIIGKFTQYGRASGDTLQTIKEDLRNEIEDHQRSNSPADRKVAMALKVAQEAVENMIERENPKYAPEYKALRKGYAKFDIAKDAAALTGAKGGIPTPNQYRSSVRANDKSKGKDKFARGRALQQPLAEAGVKHLATEVPDSGTPTRIATMELVGGGGAATAMLHNPAFLLTSAAVPLLYSQFGLRAIQPLLLGRVKAAPAATGAIAGGMLGTPPDNNPLGLAQ